MNTRKPEALTLTLPLAGMEVVFSALGELPYRVAQPVIDAANAQFSEQLAAQKEPARAAANPEAAHG